MAPVVAPPTQAGSQDRRQSSLNSESGNVRPSVLEHSVIEPTTISYSADTSFDFVLQNKESWNQLTKFPLQFRAVMATNNQIIIDESSVEDNRYLDFKKRTQIQILDPKSAQIATRNERMMANVNKQPSKKHFRTKPREHTFEMSDDMEYILTDIPPEKKPRIYKEENFGKPIKLLIQEHKSLGLLEEADDEYIKEKIMPEVENTYRFAEIMQRKKNTTAYESTGKFK